MNDPLITLCICGKDDNYVDDFLYRIETTINYICQEIEGIKKEKHFELIIVDWASKKPMHDTLSLNSNLKSSVNFLYITENFLKDSKYNRDNIPICYALNLAIRRASGKFIFVTSADTILNDCSLLALFNICSKEIKTTFTTDKSYFTIGRKHIPWEIISQQPNPFFLKNYLERNGHELRSDFGYLRWGGGAGLIGMHRNIWELNEGLDEGIVNYGASDVEIFLRSTNKCEHIELSNLGICSYHMKHPPEKQTMASKYVKKNYNIFKNNRKPNPNWGDPDITIREYKLSSKVLLQKKTNKAPFIDDLEDKYNHISQLSIFFKKLQFDHHLNTNLIALSLCIDQFNPKTIIFEESELNLIYLFFAARFYHIPKYYIYTKRFSNIFGTITDSINFLSNICHFKGTARWFSQPGQKIIMNNDSTCIIVLGNNDCRSKIFQVLNLDKVCCLHLEFKNRSSICNNDFRFISGKNIGSVISSLSAGILIVKNHNKEQVPFEYKIKPKIDFVIKMKFRNYINSLKDLLN